MQFDVTSFCLGILFCFVFSTVCTLLAAWLFGRTNEWQGFDFTPIEKDKDQ